MPWKRVWRWDEDKLFKDSGQVDTFPLANKYEKRTRGECETPASRPVGEEILCHLGAQKPDLSGICYPLLCGALWTVSHAQVQCCRRQMSRSKCRRNSTLAKNDALSSPSRPVSRPRWELPWVIGTAL